MNSQKDKLIQFRRAALNQAKIAEIEYKEVQVLYDQAKNNYRRALYEFQYYDKTLAEYKLNEKKTRKKRTRIIKALKTPKEKAIALMQKLQKKVTKEQYDKILNELNKDIGE